MTVKNISNIGTLLSQTYALPSGGYLSVDPDGQSAHFSYHHTGADMFRVFEVMMGFSEPLKQAIASTNAMQGTRTWSERGMNFSWAYHPDNGLNLSIQVQELQPIPADAKDICLNCFAPVASDAISCSSCHIYTTHGSNVANAKNKQVHANNAVKIQATQKSANSCAWTFLGIVVLILIGGFLYAKTVLGI